jgi:Protein of unknown function (DUF2442)
MVEMASVKHRVPSDAEIEGARRLAIAERPKSAVAASYDQATDEVVLAHYCGATVRIPRKLFPHIESARPADLVHVELTPAGTAIRFPLLDADYSVPGMLRRIFGLNEDNRRAGATKSSARAAASRKNGKKGGRPKKALLTRTGP